MWVTRFYAAIQDLPNMKPHLFGSIGSTQQKEAGICTCNNNFFFFEEQLFPISSADSTQERFCLSGGKSHFHAKSHGPPSESCVTQFNEWCVLELCTMVDLLGRDEHRATGSCRMATRDVGLRLHPSMWQQGRTGWNCTSSDTVGPEEPMLLEVSHALPHGTAFPPLSKSVASKFFYYS